MPSAGFEKFDRIKRDAYLGILRAGGRRCAAARAVGIHPETVGIYRNRHAGFAAEESLAEVEASEVVETAVFKAAASGDMKAAQLWLYNRDPENWSDRRSVRTQVSGPGDGPISVNTGSYVRSVLADPVAIELALEVLDRVAEADPR